MKFTLEPLQSNEDRILVELISHENDDLKRCLATITLTLELKDGQLGVAITTHNTAARPNVVFDYAKVSEVHRSTEWNPDNIPTQQQGG